MSFQKQCFDYVDIPQPSLWAGLIETTSAKKKEIVLSPGIMFILHISIRRDLHPVPVHRVCPLLGKIEMKAVEL